MKLTHGCLAFFLHVCTASALMAQTDSFFQMLDSVSIVRKRVTSPMKGSVATTLLWDMGMMHELPKILGNADPMHYTQLLPGVQTCSEYDAGLHVQGCDNAHNFVAIDDVPVYNASHMLGLFSIFNASHFPRMHFTKSPLTASAANRLGGALNMELPDELPDRTNGEFTVGPMSSQGTFRFPVGKNGGLFVSMRAAYLNLLYSRWLEIDGSQLAYSFQDYNLTYFHRWGTTDKLWFNFYYGDDRMGLDEEYMHSDMRLKWGNLLASVRWTHRTMNGSRLMQMVYYTGYKNRFAFDMPETRFTLPSHIYTYGYKGRWEYRNVKVGAEAASHHLQPQAPRIVRGGHTTASAQDNQRSQEYVLYLDYTLPFGEWALTTGVKGTLYHVGSGATYASADPTVSLAWQAGSVGCFRLSYGWQHQYLCKTGFSNMGLPTEYWFSGGTFSPPQYAQSGSLSYETELFDGDYSLTVEAYYKKLYHQVEYNGNVLDFLNTVYDPEAVLLQGDGENYGVNLMLNKRTGRLTGWLSYAWGRAFRRFAGPQYPSRYPASHERIHELNAVATYRFNDRWSAGGTFVVASGTPFTAPKHFYLMNGQLVSEYGEHNANRLNPYCRLDLSVNYNFMKKAERESGLNFSLYNALYLKNDIFYRLKIYEGEFGYLPIRFLMRILPSVSYYYKF